MKYFYSILFTTLFIAKAANAQVNIQDSLALVDLYNSTNGPNWVNKTGWLNGPINRWFGITISNNRVSRIILNGNNLAGAIPASLGNFDQLTFLWLNDNALTGTIPSSLGNLMNLAELYLFNNKLNGAIPSSIGSLKKLTQLYLHSNLLTGNIPVTLEGNIQLQWLNLDDNQLSGEIPIELGNIKTLTYLNLGYNKFTGEIPFSIGNLTALKTLILNGDHLKGNITSLGNLVNLSNLQLNSNEFVGEIPSTLANLVKLQILDLSSNKFSGEIPVFLGNLTALNDLRLFANELSGEMPVELGNLKHLKTLLLSYNQLSGGIPDWLGGIKDLQELALNHNSFSGEMPQALENLKSLQVLNFGENNLSGVVPSWLGNIQSLTSIALYSNHLTGKIPTTLGNLHNLSSLLLSENGLSGEIPSTLTDLINLSQLELSGNKLSGNIPLFIGNLVNLQYLYLDKNQFTGNIPSSLENLKKLYSLTLSNNKLNGNIPTFLSNFKTLSQLTLGNNYLSGSIPATLSNLTHLTQLSLENNHLSGNIPFFAPKSVFLNGNWFTFQGLESHFVNGGNDIRDYSPQSNIPLILKGTKLVVSVGGTPAKNTFTWYHDGLKVSKQLEDSTLNPNGAGKYWATVTNSAVSGLTLFSDTITLSSDLSILTSPKIYVSKGTTAAGDIQTITGNDFTPRSTINLFIKNSEGDLITSNNSFSYTTSGGFSYQLPVVATMPDGEYKVYAFDVISGAITPTITFLVVNPVQSKLAIIAPSASDFYEIGKPTQIIWKDFITKSLTTGNSGLVQKIYKIEFSDDNGVTWQKIDDAFTHSAPSNQFYTFSIYHTFNTAGPFKIRITDVANINNLNISKAFILGVVGDVAGFTTSLEWDNSWPYNKDYWEPTPPHPIGLAADGVSRIFIKLTRDAGNVKPVKSVRAVIERSGTDNSSSGTALLGKLMLATNTTSYDGEANGANHVDTTVVPPPLEDIWFWLVAPDDFTQTLDNNDRDRTIKVTFKITYNNNTEQTVVVDNIVIVRPPLLLVHGLNADASSFSNLRYTVNGAPKQFIYSTLFQNDPVAVNLKNYESFQTNAEILLAIGDPKYNPGINSFQYALNKLHQYGYAANRLDYVCHSMGGAIARTIINLAGLQGFYKPGPNSSSDYKNYDKGFINKLITINTPHNGSPLADLFDDLLPSKVLYNLSINSDPTNLNPNGFFVRTHTGLFFNKYDLSPAMKDLKAIHGGIRFNETPVKNHLIGGDIDSYNVPNSYLLLQLNGNPKIKYLLDVATVLLPKLTLSSTGIIDGINAYISSRYGYPNFLSNSDGIVPINSQFPGLNENNIPLIENTVAVDHASIGFGFNRNHIQITDDLAVGNKIMRLLNASINSKYFADEIPANTNSGGTNYFINGNSPKDSILYYIDTSFVKIISPGHFSTVYVDSIIDVKAVLKDTVNLLKLQLLFQGEYYESFSKTSNQVFNIKVQSNSLGYNMIVCNAVYDSSGFTVYHTDTTALLSTSLDSIKGFYISPKSQNLNRAHIFHPIYNVIYNKFVATLNDNNDSLSFYIADTNVVKYVDSLREFITKDTGTTYILYGFKGFTDTGYIYVSQPQEGDVLPVTLYNFVAEGSSCKKVRLSWQTASERNNYGFEVQQSGNGNKFIAVAFVKSKGNSSSPSHYIYAIDILDEGTYYYRLKQIDLDGRITFSETRVVNLYCHDTPALIMYPNPSKGKFNLVINGSTSSTLAIKIYDSHGKIVKALQPKNYVAGNAISIDLSLLASGTYFIQANINGKLSNKKIELIK